MARYLVDSCRTARNLRSGKACPHNQVRLKKLYTGKASEETTKSNNSNVERRVPVFQYRRWSNRKEAFGTTFCEKFRPTTARLLESNAWTKQSKRQEETKTEKHEARKAPTVKNTVTETCFKRPCKPRIKGNKKGVESRRPIVWRGQPNTRPRHG
jgi:hypothetical protein